MKLGCSKHYRENCEECGPSTYVNNQMKIEFKTPQGPNFLLISSPPALAGGGQTVPISMLSPEQLSEVAYAWRADLFRRAGHKDPALAHIIKADATTNLR